MQGEQQVRGYKAAGLQGSHEAGNALYVQSTDTKGVQTVHGMSIRRVQARLEQSKNSSEARSFCFKETQWCQSTVLKRGK